MNYAVLSTNSYALTTAADDLDFKGRAHCGSSPLGAELVPAEKKLL